MGLYCNRRHQLKKKAKYIEAKDDILTMILSDTAKIVEEKAGYSDNESMINFGKLLGYISVLSHLGEKDAGKIVDDVIDIF